MAKFSFTVDTDNSSEAVRIAEYMGDLAYFLKTGKKSKLEWMDAGPREVEFVLINGATSAEFSGKTKMRKQVQEGVNTLVEWLQTAKTVEDLKRLLVDNSQFIRAVATRDHQKRIESNAKKRETTLEAANVLVEKKAAPRKAVTLEELNDAFRTMYERVGDKQCLAILKTFKAVALKDVPPEKWLDCMDAIQSALVAKRVNGEQPARVTTPSPP